jgi:DNA-binding IclR family transcriptional regulator
LALGYAFVSNLTIRQIARPLMQELANTTGTAVGLSDRDRLEMIYVEYCAPTNVTTFRHEIGDKVPMINSSAGRAYLAALPNEEQEYFLSYIKRKTKDDWPHLKASLDETIANYQQRGFCYSYGDWDHDVNGISVPLELSQGNIFVFNAGGPAFRLTTEFLENEVAPQLKSMVRNIEAMLVRY